MSTEEGTITRRRSFAQIPNDLITDTRVSPLAVRLWARLDRYAGGKGGAMPARSTLATDLGISEATVKRGLAELVDNGWITRRRIGSSNVWETSLNEQARVTSDPTPGAKRVTSDPETGHGRPGNGSRVTRPRKETGDVETKTSAADAADGDELDLGLEAPRSTGRTVQILVGAFDQEVKRRGGTASSQLRGRVGAAVKRLLGDGIPEGVLLEAVVRAGARGRADIDSILASPNGPQNAPRAERDRMFARWEEIAEQFDRRQQP